MRPKRQKHTKRTEKIVRNITTPFGLVQEAVACRRYSLRGANEHELGAPSGAQLRSAWFQGLMKNSMNCLSREIYLLRIDTEALDGRGTYHDAGRLQFHTLSNWKKLTVR
jgi:hypothetical protein